MRKLIYLLFIFLMSLFILPLEATNATAGDSLYPNTEEYIRDIHYDNYGPYKSVKKIDLREPSWLENLRVMLSNFFRSAKYAINTLLVLLVVLLLICLALKVQGYDFGFFKKKEIDKNTVFDEISIGHRDFEAELKQCLTNADYNGAVRVLYVYALSVLDAQNLIKWNISKTPAEYLYEIKQMDIRKAYHALTVVYLSVCFGNTEATSDSVAQAQIYLNAMRNVNSKNSQNHAV